MTEYTKKKDNQKCRNIGQMEQKGLKTIRKQGDNEIKRKIIGGMEHQNRGSKCTVIR